jgi:hypothetical protein
MTVCGQRTSILSARGIKQTSPPGSFCIRQAVLELTVIMVLLPRPLSKLAHGPSGGAVQLGRIYRFLSECRTYTYVQKEAEHDHYR